MASYLKTHMAISIYLSRVCYLKVLFIYHVPSLNHFMCFVLTRVDRGIAKVAKKLGIDYSEAIVSFFLERGLIFRLGLSLRSRGLYLLLRELLLRLKMRRW
jgi:hypothetical protein